MRLTLDGRREVSWRSSRSHGPELVATLVHDLLVQIAGGDEQDGGQRTEVGPLTSNL